MPILKKRYYSVNGVLVGERTTGQERVHYMPDPLGNITAVQTTSGGVKTASYTPTGAGTPPVGASMGWVGIHGYRPLGLPESSHYMIHRTYSDKRNRWNSVDMLWPRDQAYTYVDVRQVSRIDWSGMQATSPIPKKRPGGRAWWELWPVIPARRRKPIPGMPIYKPPPAPSPPGTLGPMPSHGPMPVGPKGIDLPPRDSWLGGYDYGQYCGPNTIKNPGAHILPQDCIDLCCLAHDRCIEANYAAGMTTSEAHSCCDSWLHECAAGVLAGHCCETSPLPGGCQGAAEEIEALFQVLGSVIFRPDARCRCVPMPLWNKFAKVYWGDAKCSKPHEGAYVDPPGDFGCS